MAGTRRQACDSCYRRKIQCDTSEREDLCNWCLHHDLPCTYNRVRGRKKRVTKENASKRPKPVGESVSRSRGARDGNWELSDSGAPPTPLSSHEQSRQGHTTSKPCTRAQTVSPFPAVSRAHNTPPLGQIYYSGQNFGALCSPTGIPHFTTQCEEWIHSRTGQWPRFRSLMEGHHLPTACSTPSTSSEKTYPNGVVDLPERSTTERLFYAFLRSGFSLCFPLVDRVLFQDTLRLAYSTPDDPSDLEYIGARACVFAFVAIVSSHSLAGSSHVDTDGCARQGQLLLADVLEDGGLTTLQTVFMLMFYEGHCGNIDAASMYHAVACRTVFALGGHTIVPPSPGGERELSPQERHDSHVRMIFWLCYGFDKDIALRSGQPPIISDDFCDLTLPEGYPEGVFGARRDHYTPEDSPTPFLPGDLRLALLKSKAVKALYSAASLRKSDAELLRTIRELDEELERWRASIPEDFAPALSVRRDVKLVGDLNKSSNMLHIELHLDYHYLLNIIHCASGRCVVDWNGPDSDKSFGVQSSLELSVTASRSTIIYLSAAAHRLAGEAFWLFIFYPVSALMSLFFNILRNPHHEYAVHDVELIISAVDIIRSMPMRRVTARETAYLQRMDVFLVELSRLARCAIDKRRGEQTGV